jgi:hypothetical protein
MVPFTDDSAGPSDGSARRAATCAALSRHRDPLVRELGLRLSRGFLAPRDVLAAPAYRDVVDAGLRRLRDLAGR